MEESHLLKERLQAITEKRRIQEDIRQKKQELDREKLKLQHLKKRAMRERWLLEDSHNALQQQQSLLADQQQTRALQINIHRIERDVESLEREESVISTNERFILKRLKAVEKSPKEIIKEAQDNFIPALFSMDGSVTKNPLTEGSRVVSTSTVCPQELNQHTGVKVHHDSRTCVYALDLQQGSHDQGCVSELSANEVERLLRDATQHHHGNPNHPKHSIREGRCYSNHQDELPQGEGHHRRNQGAGHYHGNHHLREEEGCYSNHQKNNCQRKQGEGHHYGDRTSHYSSQERNDHNNQRAGHHVRNHQGEGHHYGNLEDHQYSVYQERNCHGNPGYQHGIHLANDITRSNSRINGGRVNLPRSHAQEVVSAYQPELCYTPTNHIPLSEYISVEEDGLYLYSPPPYHSFNHSDSSHNGDNQSALYCGPAHYDRVPSPLYEADTPYTILSSMETSEPITAIFLGFQTSQDESGPGQDYEGSIKAELVIISDTDDDCNDSKMKEGKSHAPFGVYGCPAGHSANGKVGHGAGGDRRTERRVGPGIRKILKKHNPCCAVC